MKRVLAVSLFGLLATAACGGGGVPAAGPTRESGQSSLMDNTVAGKNRCSPKNHERPFIIEWDATDMSSFESLAANDVVFVKYEGCDLQVIGTCKDDSVKGALGAYKPVDWTSGSLETIDIANEGELYAKLPLGSASLGGRVEAGEKFHMEYYVSGTRNATRAAVYKKELAKNPGCQGVTHFVYGYNLGAFALGSATKVKGTVGGSAFGFGAGGSKTSSSSAEKKGGQLSSCSSDSAKEIDTCKAPIRLTLREISDGDNPDVAAASAPETPEAMNLAGKVDAKVKQNEKAQAHWDAAQERFNSHDGAGCLRELDARDQSDHNATNLTTNPKSAYGFMRAQCLMISGKCDAGKGQYRKWMEARGEMFGGSDRIDQVVDAYAGKYCQGGSMSPRDQLLHAASELQSGAYMSKKDPAACLAAYATLKKLTPVVKPRDDEDTQVKDAMNGAFASGPNCLAKAGDCANAKKVFKEIALMKAAGQTDAMIQTQFEAIVPKCKGK